MNENIETHETVSEVPVSPDAAVQAPIAMDFNFLPQVEAESGANVSACFQCGKCSNGCPLSFAMDYHPYQVIRFVHLGARDKLVNSRTIWICASCQTCNTRCPNEIDIPRLMDYLKEAVSNGAGHIAEKDTALFHQTFLDSVQAHGRVFEGGFMQRFLIKSGRIWDVSEMMENAKLGYRMLRKHRMKLLPDRIKGRKEVKAMFRKSK